MKFFTAKQLKPQGWLKRQLQIQAEGLSGHLDKIWPDIADSIWIGGKRDAIGSLERVPYWLDGFVPLAYLLDDADMIARAKKYINAILAGQREDGWLYPYADQQNYDTWTLQLTTKVLLVYYECSGDKRVPCAIERALKNYHHLLSTGEITLFDWGKFRWFETFVALNFVAQRCNEPWVGELAKMLDEQGHHYENTTELWKRPLNKWTFETHVVNLAMMLKFGVVTAQLLGDKYPNVADELYDLLMQYNGTPVGIFTGDECLSGVSPIQGTELCAVAELMYSCEVLFAHTGNKKWADILELLAFNAMPATVSDDMWTHQYVQMSNQISCEKFPGRPIFRTNGGESHLFGLEPNFGCCTANFNQAFPKFALSAFLQDDDGIVSVTPLPCTLATKDFSVTICTEYPFKNTAHYEVRTTRTLTLKIRVPNGTTVVLNGSPQQGDYVVLHMDANSHNIFEVQFVRKPILVDRPNGLKTVQYGPLVFAVPIEINKKMHEYTNNGVERKFPYCDYEYIGTSPWSFAYASDIFEVEEREMGQYPFGSAPAVVLKATVVPINWGLEDGFETVAAKLPHCTTPTGPTQTITLHPYGCAKLRMTELPLCKLDEHN